MGRFDPLIRHLRAMAIALALAGAALAPAAVLAATTEHAAPAAAEHGAPAAAEHGADPAAVIAADEHAAEAHGAEGEHGGGGLPQLDASTFASQIFWLIVAFATLYWLLSTKALPRVGEILEARQERIASDLDRAAALRADAEEAMRRHEQVVSEAQAKAAAQLKATQERMAAEAAQRQAAIEADLNQKLAEAEGRIATAKSAALAQIQDVAAEVAQTAVERLAGLRLAESEVKAALADVMREAA